MNHERRSPQSKDPQNAANPQGAQQLTLQTRHAHKPDRAQPSSGGTARPEKHDGKNREEALAQPSCGYTCHPEKADGKNRVEPVANPQGA
jgi:hypothetical protein